MSETPDPRLEKLLSDLAAKDKKGKGGRWPDGPVVKGLKERTRMSQDAPAPHLEALIEAQGLEPTREALAAWDDRINGMPIVDVAHKMGCSIELAKQLISEVHHAIHEDLKAALELNRTLDLSRIDGLIASYYPAAKGGDERAAGVVLKALQHRAKLTGAEPSPEPARFNHVETVQAWIVNVLPSINRFVDDLPKE